MMLWSKTSSVALLCLASRSAYAFTRTSSPRLLLTPLPRRTFTTGTSSSSSSSSTTLAATTQYLLTYNYIPDVLEKRGPFRSEHLQLAQDMVTAGTCLYGGPKGGPPLESDGAASPTPPPTGALFIFTDLQAAQDFVQKDPYVSGGIVTTHSIEAWTVAVSKDA